MSPMPLVLLADDKGFSKCYFKLIKVNKFTQKVVDPKSQKL